MKKIFTTLLFIFFLSVCKAQWVTIPNSNFRSWLNSHGYSSCMSGTLMDTSCAAVLNATTIDCSNYNIADITGIRYFKHLKNFTCNYNPILFIPALPDSLQKLTLWYNKFDSVLALPSTLTYLNIGSDSLEYIASFPDSLLEFYSSAKHMHSLPALPMFMKILEVTNTPLYNFSSPLPDSLRVFYCYKDSLLSLPTLPIKINKLYIYQNQISVLPQLPDSLVTLYGYTNPITALPALPSKLQVLDMGGNLLTSLPSLPQSLIELYVAGELLTSLPDLPNDLLYLNAQHNLLTSSPALPYNLKQLDLSYNQISSIDSFPPNLNLINVSGNLLTTLPPFHDPATGTPIANFLYLNCDNNQLQNIPKLPNRMNGFSCRYNPLLQCLPSIDRIYFTTNYNFYSAFALYGTNINCISSYIVHPNNTSYIWDELNSMPICLPANTNDCNVNWNLDGKVELDADSSCLTLNDGTGIGGIKILLFDSLNHLVQQTYTRNDGSYSFIAPYGPYHIKVDTTYSPFQVLCPVANYTGGTLTLADSVHHSIDFRLKCRNIFSESNNQGLNVVHNKIFSPGDTTAVHVLAGNIGEGLYTENCYSTLVYGEVKVVLNGSISFGAPLPGALVPTVNGDTLTYMITNFEFVNYASDFGFTVITNVAATVNENICFEVAVKTILGISIVNLNEAKFCFTVSSVPLSNYKEVNPSGKITDYPYSGWLTYTIYFQNTGNTIAQDVKITDVIDADLNLSTFELLTVSDTPVVQIRNDEVSFIFKNLNLPYSSIDEEGSKGYVSFRIKMNQGISIYAVIKNKASIFFNHNNALVTNTTSTSFCHVQPINTLATICYGDTFNYHGQVLTQSGIYSASLSAINGCDTIETLSLNVLPHYYHSFNIAICEDDSFLFDGLYRHTAGTYAANFSSVTGCDSVEELHLFTFSPIIHSVVQTICNNDIFYFGGQQLTQSGNYTATFNSYSGCDSIVHLSLVVLPAPAPSSFNESICAGGVFYFNGVSRTTTGTWSANFPAANGCDSLVTLHLFVYPANTNVSQHICAGDFYSFNGMNLSDPGIYNDTVITSFGCDSITTLNLVVDSFDTYIQIILNTLIVNTSGSVQWIDCNNNLPVAGATQSSFIPTTPGSYAAIITEGNCIDTTACVAYTSSNENIGNSLTQDVIVFPNPVSNWLVVQSSQFMVNTISISDVLGRIVLTSNFKQSNFKLNLKSFPSGIYFLTISNSDFSVTKKIVKQ